MTSRGLKRTVIAASIAIGLASTSFVHAQPNCPPPPAQNPTTQQVDDARKLFQEAYKDEQDGKFEDALRKFQDVAKVKESASVRYRIAKNQANLGRLREARDNMRALAATKDCLPPKDRNIADSAAAEVLDLEKKIPKLSVKVQDKAPNDTRVSVDGTPVPSTGTTKPIELDPGDHTVAANGSGMKAFEKKVHLNAGSNENVTVQFEQEGVAGPNPNPNPPPENPNPPPPSRGALPYVLVIGGGALVIIGGSMLLAREGTIDDINKTCPNGVCPTNTRIDIEDKRDSAATMLPVGLTLLGVGAVATGLGVYLFVRPLKQPDQPANGTQPASPRGQSFHFGPKPVRGGMMLGVGATF